MSKKRKRQGLKSSGRKTVERQRKRSRSMMTSEEFNPDYSYVVEDLRRIGILAGSIITILVLLAIFIG